MEPWEKYVAVVIDLIKKIEMEEKDQIVKAAEVISDKIVEDRLIYAYGPGHGNMATEELFFRAGGLVPINPIFDAGVSLSNVLKCVETEKIPGYTKASLNYYGLGGGDVIIICDYAGVNATTVDAAMEAKKRGAISIAITSSAFAKKVPLGSPARHPSNKNLFEIADIFIDTHAPPGDAAIEVEGCDTKVAPVSTIANTFIINSIVVQVVTNLVKRGVRPPIWVATSIVGSEKINKEYIDKYFGRIKHL